MLVNKGYVLLDYSLYSKCKRCIFVGDASPPTLEDLGATWQCHLGQKTGKVQHLVLENPPSFGFWRNFEFTKFECLRRGFSWGFAIRVNFEPPLSLRKGSLAIDLSGNTGP